MVECGEDGVWKRLSDLWRRVWGGLGIGDIECFMKVKNLHVFEGLVQLVDLGI